MTEEVWNWYREGSVHIAPWPVVAVTVRAPQAQVEALESVKGDLEAVSKAVGALTVDLRRR